MKITKRQLRRIIRESLLVEGPIDWLKNKAGTEYDEAKFRVLWEKELLTTLNPGTKALMKNIDINGIRGERIAKAWVKVGHEKFTKAAKNLKGKQKTYFVHLVNGFGVGAKFADLDKFSQQIDDLFDTESKLYKKTNQTSGEKFKKIWNKYFG